MQLNRLRKLEGFTTQPVVGRPGNPERHLHRSRHDVPTSLAGSPHDAEWLGLSAQDIETRKNSRYAFLIVGIVTCLFLMA